MTPEHGGAPRQGTGPRPPTPARTLSLRLAQALLPLALLLGGPQLGQLVAQLLAVHQGPLLLRPLLLQLCLQRVRLALQLRDVPLGLWRQEGRVWGPCRACMRVGPPTRTPPPARSPSPPA